jgi:hypothetical protein
MGQRIRMKAEEVAHGRHQPKSIDEFGEGMALFLANTVGDDVGFAGKPASGGPPRSSP